MGYDLFDDELEIMPAQWGVCGGLKIDESYGTHQKMVFAAGEVACGIQGVQTLPGNELLFQIHSGF